jgi:hypothetical protein
MGIKQLYDSLKELEEMNEEKDIIVHALPKGASVVFDDILVRLNKLAGVECMEFSDAIAILVNPVVKFFRAPNARIAFVGVDGKNVTARKRVTQEARAGSRAKRKIFPYPDTVSCTDHGLYDSVTGRLSTTVDMARLACSRHIRHALVGVMWRELCKHSFPDHAFIFFDAFDNQPVPMLHGGRITYVAAAAEISAEAEVRNVLRARQMLAHFRDGLVTIDGLPSVPLNMVLKTVDGDTVPVVVRHFWDTVFPPGVTLSFLHKADIHIDVINLIAMLKRHGWTWQMFTAACIMSETDYSFKAHYTSGVGREVAWKAWNTAAAAVPADVRTNLYKLLEPMICTAYVSKIKGEHLRAPSNRAAMLKYVDITNVKALKNHMFNNEEKESKGKDNYMWLWEYWGTLGRYASAVTPTRWPLAPAAPAGYTAPVAVHHAPSWQFGGPAPARAAAPAPAPAPARAAAAAAAAGVDLDLDWLSDAADLESLIPAAVSVTSGKGTAEDVALLCDDLT